MPHMMITTYIGLQVPVDEAMSVHVLKPLEDLLDDYTPFVLTHWLNEGFQRAQRKVLHRQADTLWRLTTRRSVRVVGLQ